MRHARVQKRRRRMLSRRPALGSHQPVVLPFFFSPSPPAAVRIMANGFPSEPLPPKCLLLLLLLLLHHLLLRSLTPLCIFRVTENRHFIYFGHVRFLHWQVVAGEVRVRVSERERERERERETGGEEGEKAKTY
jgi:hypothetical protein